MWDPDRYLRFAGQRARPFADLLAQVPAEPGTVAEVADLGCGPGTLTVGLAQRWPGAHVVGVDSSAEMIAATPADPPAGVEFVEADLRDWAPGRPVDVLVSNATLQWVPGHLELLPRLAGHVGAGGWLAFQVPGNFAEPAHVILRELAAGVPALRDLSRPSSHDPAVYLDALLELGFAADVWETTYVQLLQGDDAVLEWMSGTGLRPVLAALADDDAGRAAFVAEYRDRLRAAYPPGPHGTVLPYRRIFAVGQKIGTETA